MIFQTLPIPVDDKVPEGYSLILAYGKDEEVVIPIDERELKNHDCDWEGCTTISHVVRFNISDKYEKMNTIYNIEKKIEKVENIMKSDQDVFSKYSDIRKILDVK